MNARKKSVKNTGKTNQTLAPIAIVGMAGILPKAENLNQYWENILEEVNCISEVPPSRWEVDAYYDPDPTAEDKSYNKHGGFIPDIPFDPMEFGLPPNILEVTDVSQLLSLIVAKQALADAGYGSVQEGALDHTGVILGMVGMSSKVIHPLLNRLQYPVWEKVLRASAVAEDEIPAIIEKMKLAYVAWNENSFPGAIGNVVAGRIANRLDLGGTNCIVDAACGSSLAAVSMAISELTMGRADMMITGGVDTDNSILTYLCFSKTPAFSKGDRLRAFSADSEGMLVGEGIGMLVLKRLNDAERDGDRIYAVIRGVGTSSDGHFKSIYAPRPSGQAKAVRRAYENCGYTPASLGLIEAHGTGTIAGDPAEFEGLREVFCEIDPEKQHIALGSVKSQIGHTKATAGAASMIKTSLALHHKILPATINVSEPNPDMDIENTPFYLNTQTRPWFKNGQGIPRRAGVSSFGFGGTNFHIALEEYQPEQKGKYRLQPVPYTVLLSAQSAEELVKNCQETLEKLEGRDKNAYLNQLDQAAEQSIPLKNVRVGFIAEGSEQACGKLRDAIKMLTANPEQKSWSHPKGIFYRKAGINPKGKTVALFPGQGSQYVNMGRELAINFPPMREAFEKANKIISAGGREALTNMVFPIPVFSDEDKARQVEQITRTENAQPAIGTFSLALYRLLQAAGFKADFFAGHSFGELTALWAAGVYDEETFLRLAKARGEAMSTPAAADKDTGTMIAVKGDVQKVQQLLKDNKEVSIANFNSTSQVVLAGATPAIEAIKPKLEEAGLTIYPLQVSAAFHTSFVKHAQAPFKKAIQKETFKEPAGRVYSNSSAQEHVKDAQKISQMLADHILNPVKFKEEIENIYAEGGSIFIEIGPKRVLINLVKDILKEQPHETISLNASSKGDSDMQYRQALLEMRVLGFKLGTGDPYRQYQQTTQRNYSKVTVNLNGGLYTSKKTRAAFEQALLEKPVSNSKPLPLAAKSIENQNTPVQRPLVKTPVQPAPVLKVSSMNNNKNVQSLIERFQEHQQDFLKTHEQFLQNDSTSKAILQEITQAEIAILSKQNGNEYNPSVESALSTMSKKAEFVNQQQNGTSAAHLEYIRSQTAFSQQYAALLKELVNSNGNFEAPIESQPDNEKTTLRQSSEIASFNKAPAPSPQAVAPAPAAATQPTPQSAPAATAAYDAGQLTQSFLDIVSDKTGYPADMLELNMDMEADLGIDSIKRVEILGAMQEQYPELPTIEAEDLALLRTLDQIINALNSAPQSAAPAAAVPMETESAAPVSTPASTYSDVELQNAFLAIVSDKTGYPADMLELSMDMEADLGIDSIKRVEILGAMQEQYPELPTIEAEDLAVLRTLEQIIATFHSTPQSTAPTAAASVKTESAQAASAPSTNAPTSAYSDAELQSAFLDIVSDKTGYPADMLELSMDMEADLGIDSIKRVEILGAMQEQYPELPTIEAEDLAVLRTLEQIIATFHNESQSAPTSTSTPVVPETKTEPEAPGAGNIQRMPVKVTRLPKPDYLDFELPQDAMVLITDDGTDKTRLLAESFQKKGLPVGLLHFSEIDSPNTKGLSKDIQHFPLKAGDEENIQETMKTISTKNSKLSAFIHMHPSNSDKSKGILEVPAQEEDILKSVFLIARHLNQPLTSAAGKNSRSAFLTVTQIDGQFGLNGNASNNPVSGGLSGLAKTLRLEWTNVFCRALDLHPDIDAQTVVEIIGAELHDPDLRLAEVGYTLDSRCTLSLENKN